MFPRTTKLSKLIIGIAAASILLSACVQRTAIRGNLPREEKLSKLKVGEFNTDQVVQLIGTPSTSSTFDGNIWYYISRKTEKIAFFDETVVDQKVIVLFFNDKNVLEAIYRYNNDDRRQVELVERTTPTAGKELSVIEQLIGNIGRFGNQ